jgi:S-adenosylmethionine:tRNA-ribosyltransferase-isomerase (queuine synthetase)
MTIIGLENEITITFSKEKLKGKTLEDLKNEKIKINFNEMDENEIEKLKKEYGDFDAKYVKDKEKSNE